MPCEEIRDLQWIRRGCITSRPRGVSPRPTSSTWSSGDPVEGSCARWPMRSCCRTMVLTRGNTPAPSCCGGLNASCRSCRRWRQRIPKRGRRAVSPIRRCADRSPDTVPANASITRPMARCSTVHELAHTGKYRGLVHSNSSSPADGRISSRRSGPAAAEPGRARRFAANTPSRRLCPPRSSPAPACVRSSASTAARPRRKPC